MNQGISTIEMVQETYTQDNVYQLQYSVLYSKFFKATEQNNEKVDRPTWP